MSNQAPIDQWLADALADATRRGLPDLVPLLESLAQSTVQLRRADWNEDASDAPMPPGAREEGR